MNKQPPILPLNVRPVEKDEAGSDDAPTKLYAHLDKLLGEWKDHRSVSIEDVWDKAHKNFNGQFDDNGGETSTRSSKAWRSKAFYPLTEQKVTAAQAQLQDILFKGGRFPYEIKSTPIPDDPEDMASAERVAEGGAMSPEQMAQVNAKAAEKQNLKARMKNMTKRMDDQFAETDAASVGLVSIFDGALYGTAFLESPKVVRKKRYKWVQKGKSYDKKEVYEDVPTVANLNPWDCWADPECGGMVDKGIGFFHREKLSAPGLQDLYDLVFPNGIEHSNDAESEEYEYDYNKKEFDALMANINKTGKTADRVNVDTGPNDAKESGHENRVYDVYNFAGAVQNKLLKEYIKDLDGSDARYSEVIIVFCNTKVIKCVLNPFPGQRRPYHMVPWTKVPGSAYGRGVAQKIFDAQKNVNRLMRMYIDNKRLSGNLMTAIDKSKLKRGESLELYPGRNFEFEGAFQDGDVRQMIQPIFFPDVTAGVLEAIGTMVQWADQSSGVPRILEGQPGSDSSTAYAENQRIAAASKQLGLVLKNYDIHAWVPIVESFYDWNMEFLKDPNVKGDYCIVATGFSTFENKHLRKLDLERLLLMSQQMPALSQKVKSDPIVEDWAIAGNIDPEKYLLSAEEVAAKMEQQQQQQLQMQAAAMQMDQQKQNMEHQFDVEMERVKGELSAQTRMALAQINAQSKAMSDETKKLMKLAEIETRQGQQGGAQGQRGRRNRNNSRS